MGEMAVGGSGGEQAVEGRAVATELIRARFVVNCAGLASDKVAMSLLIAARLCTPRCKLLQKCGVLSGRADGW